MSLELCYETEETLDLPYEEIAEKVIAACLAAEHCPFAAEVSLSFVDDAAIRSLNREFRNIDRETDVLSFPMLEFEAPGVFPEIGEEDKNPDTGEVPLCDIVINVGRVKSQAAEYGHSETRELAFLLAHSMLHLMGYDHMEEEERLCMESRQRDILDGLGYRR